MEKILIVDDNSELQNTLLFSLSYGGYKVIQADNGMQALEYAERDKPEVIILNVMMSGEDGFEVCRQIKSLPALVNSLVIILTSLVTTSDRAKALEVGANYYWVKPLCPIELISVLSGVRSR